MNRLNFFLDIVESSIQDLKNYIQKISHLLPITHKSYEDLISYNKDIIDAIAF